MYYFYACYHYFFKLPTLLLFSYYYVVYSLMFKSFFPVSLCFEILYLQLYYYYVFLLILALLSLRVRYGNGYSTKEKYLFQHFFSNRTILFRYINFWNSDDSNNYIIIYKSMEGYLCKFKLSNISHNVHMHTAVKNSYNMA